MITVQTTGMEAVRRELARFASSIQDVIIDRAMDIAAVEIAKIEKREVPKSGQVHYHYYGGKKITVNPGNLRNSIARIAGIKGSVSHKVRIIGPRSGRKSKFDGWYGGMVAKGTRHSRSNNFQERAAQIAAGRAHEIVSYAVEKAIVRLRR